MVTQMEIAIAILVGLIASLFL